MVMHVSKKDEMKTNVYWFKFQCRTRAGSHAFYMYDGANEALQQVDCVFSEL